MIGPWFPAEVRSKSYWWPGLKRLQIAIGAGHMTFTLYVLHAFGFAVALHLPKRLTDRVLKTEGM